MSEGAIKSASQERRVITEKALVAAVGEVLETQGYHGLTAGRIAEVARCDKALIYRYFGNLEGLLKEYGQSAHFWPDLEELFGPDGIYIKEQKEQSLARMAAGVLARYAQGLRKRPYTLAILAQECSGPTPLSKILEATREEFTHKLYHHLASQNLPSTMQIMKVTGFLAAALNYLSVRSQFTPIFSGLSLQTQEGWDEMEAMLSQILEGFL